MTYKVVLEPSDLLHLGRNTHVLTWYCSNTNTFRVTLGSYLKHFEKSKFCKENIFCKDCFLCGATSHSLLGNKTIDGQVLDREFNCPIAQYQPHQYNLQKGKIIEIYITAQAFAESYYYNKVDIINIAFSRLERKTIRTLHSSLLHHHKRLFYDEVLIRQCDLVNTSLSLTKTRTHSKEDAILEDH
jgi:hypothetical protein